MHSFQLQTVAETNRILLEAEKASPKDKQPKRKRKTKRRDHRTSPSRATARTSPSRVTARTSLSRVTPTASPQHLRVNVGKIPFVAGQVKVFIIDLHN